jgi:hypothetical protein
MAGFTLIILLVNVGTWWVLYRQLQELHDGGVDTHNLAKAAQDQSAWTQRLADNMKTQADHTKELADEAVILAKAAERSAVAAKLAADTAGDNLRPWIKIDHLSLDPSSPPRKTLTFARQKLKDGSTSYSFQLKVKITNVGHSPAREIEIVPLAFTVIPTTEHMLDDSWREEERVCWDDKPRYGLFGTGFHEFMFPSDSQEGGLEVPGTIKGIESVPIYVMLCVRYKGVGTRKHHTVASRELLGTLAAVRISGDSWPGRGREWVVA